jgi:hypothetical protein
MPFSWRPRERTRLTCSSGGDVVADIGCRRDVLTCPIVRALPVLPLPPPALPSGSNGASPASTWPIPQTERRPQSIVLRFFRNPQEDGACHQGRTGANAPYLSWIFVPHPFCCLLPLSPRHASFSTLISPSAQVALIIRQTGPPQPTNPQPTAAATCGASSASLAPSFLSRHSAALSRGYSPTAFFSAPPESPLSRQPARRFCRRRGTGASRAPPCALAKSRAPPPERSPPDRNLALFVLSYRFACIYPWTKPRRELSSLRNGSATGG